MASTLKINTLTGVSTAGSIAVTGEGNSTTTNLQQGLAKAWLNYNQSTPATVDSFSISSVTDSTTGEYKVNISSAFSNTGFSSTGMTKGSGGIFSFPSTGIYHIHFRAQVMMNSGSTGNRYAQNPIEITTNNSSYTNVSMGLDGVSPISGESFGNPIATFIFDVTDTSTHKCRFKVQSGESNWSAYVGNSSRMDTVVTFTRLGDT